MKIVKILTDSRSVLIVALLSKLCRPFFSKSHGGPFLCSETPSASVLLPFRMSVVFGRHGDIHIRRAPRQWWEIIGNLGVRAGGLVIELSEDAVIVSSSTAALLP